MSQEIPEMRQLVVNYVDPFFLPPGVPPLPASDLHFTQDPPRLCHLCTTAGKHVVETAEATPVERKHLFRRCPKCRSRKYATRFLSRHRWKGFDTFEESTCGCGHVWLTQWFERDNSMDH
jgi:hypothetical protein